MKEKFMKWVASNSTSPFILSMDGFYYNTIIKIPKSKIFYYLFSQRYTTESTPLGKENFEFCGIYCVQDGNIYCASGLITHMLSSKEVLDRSERGLMTQLVQRVRERVEKTVGNDRANLDMTKINPERIQDALSYLKHGAAAEAKARELYLEGKPLSSIDFTCNYMVDEWTKDNILHYILSPDEYVEMEYKSYMDTHQEQMLLTFLLNDMVIEEYTALTSDQANPIHIIKKIMDVAKASNARTVNVTILKDGMRATVKVNADIFRKDAECGYSYWNIASSDRLFYELKFGSVKFYPQEIVCITYGRKYLYEADSDTTD